jgi:hypothetical protein
MYINPEPRQKFQGVEPLYVAGKLRDLETFERIQFSEDVILNRASAG